VVVALLLAVPLLTAAACWVLGPRRRELAHLLGTALMLVLSIALVTQVLRQGPLRSGGGLFYVDALSALLVVIIAGIGTAAALYSVGYLRADLAHGEVTEPLARWYYPSFHLFLGTMLVTPLLNNLGLVWVGVEATTLTSVPLVAFYRTNAALEAAWKYVLLCTVGLIIALFGVVLTYVAARTAGASLDWRALAGVAGRLDPQVMRLAFVFVLVGFGVKAGFAPLHTWLPDAHSQAPSPVSALLSGVQLNCALYAVFRFYIITAKAAGPAYPQHLLIGFGLVSMLVAVPFILVQRDFKRLLAYSSVEHIGLVALALGLGGPVGLYVAVLHLLNHAVTKAFLFFVAGDISQTYHTHRINRIRGVTVAAPVTGALLLLSVLAISGMPPFGVFASELGIVAAAFTQANYAVAAALIAALALIFAGFAGHLVQMAFGRPSANEPLARARLPQLLVFAPALGMMVLFGVWVPPGVTSFITKVTDILGGRLA
jgi:hydrogenase-4 component F